MSLSKCRIFICKMSGTGYKRSLCLQIRQWDLGYIFDNIEDKG